MAGIFGSLPGGRWIGCLFFTALLIASFSSLFTFIEISVRTFEIKCRMGRRKAILVSSALIGAGNILVSLGFGILQDIKLPWQESNIMVFMTGLTVSAGMCCCLWDVYLPAFLFGKNGDGRVMRQNLQRMEGMAG